jgi:outer membrane protein assembly factor BamB
MLQSSTPPHEATYVEPSLRSHEAETLSVIVTAADSQTAAEAVERLGGQVSSDLWLIDAVGASLPVGQLEALASEPGIISIVDNKGVGTAGDPPDRPGWVTDRREKKDLFQISGKNQHTPVVFLPDGGFVSVGDGGAANPTGTISIFNADHSLRIQLELPGTHYDTTAVVALDGTIFVVELNEGVFALNPDGSTRWTFGGFNSSKFFGSVALAPDGTVYVADDDRWIFALNPVTGQELWQFQANNDQDGPVVASPAVGPDGTIYLATEGLGNKPVGHLFAVDPGGQLKWVFIAAQNKPFHYSPLVGANGIVYITSRQNMVYAVNATDGTLHYQFATAGLIEAQPVVADDGSLYVPTVGGSLYGLTPDGSLRFEFQPQTGDFRTSPVLSPDGTTVYAVVLEQVLHAVDPASGTERWRFTMAGNIKASPALDAAGNVFLGSYGKDFVGLTPAGEVMTRLRMDNIIGQSPTVNPAGNVVVLMDDNKLIFMDYLPEQWDNRPDVEPADSNREWQLSNAVGIDVGADVLHETLLPDGSPITGECWTVASTLTKKCKTFWGPTWTSTIWVRPIS